MSNRRSKPVDPLRQDLTRIGVLIEKNGVGDRVPPLRCLRLHLAHRVSEHPKGAIELHVLVDAGDGAGGH
jgi:hypothetical protein